RLFRRKSKRTQIAGRRLRVVLRPWYCCVRCNDQTGRSRQLKHKMDSSLAQRLAVCSWSLQPSDPANLVQQLQTIGINRVQIALDPIREHPQVWNKVVELFRQSNITIVSGMFGTLGEDYTTMESIRRTGGVVPDATWDLNWRNIETN